MKLSLRARVLLLVALLNALAFASAAPFLYQRLTAANEDSAGQEIGRLVRATMRPRGSLNVARILQFASWQVVEDAIVVDRNLERVSDGRYQATGVVLNLVGSGRRHADFDLQAVFRAAARAMEEEEQVVDVLGGRVVPIEDPLGRVWGACWIRAPAPLDLGPIFADLVPWFLFSTLLLTGVMFFALRELVVKPVEVLAGGARRVRAGDFGTRLDVPRRQDELADLVRSFNEMTETVAGFNERLRREVERATTEAQQAQAAAMTQRRLAAMGELAAGIAHEINNPLGGLLNAVEVLRERELPAEKERQYLALLANGLERIRTTVGQLLRFTPREARVSDVDLAEVCLDALALVRHRAQEEGVETRLHLPGREPIDVTAEREDGRRPALADVAGAVATVDGARNELGQAVLNLLVNSLDAHAGARRGAERPPPRIDVVLEESEGRVELTVSDDGPGVAAEKLLHVADLFFTTKEVGKGTGLGLSMVHNTVGAVGGEVQIDSREGEGFRVVLSFPRRRKER